MTHAQVLPHLALLPGCNRILATPDLAPSDLVTIKQSRDSFIRGLRNSQMDDAGFYVSLPSALLREIKAAPYLSVSVETTANSRYGNPLRLNAATRIGSQTWSSYRASRPATLNTVPRIRVVTLHAEAIDSCSFDLDALTDDQRHNLFDAALQHKIPVGHDLGRDLSWMFAETEARPDYLLDTMLLLQLSKPAVLLRAFRGPAKTAVAPQEACEALLKDYNGKPNASLRYSCACLKLDAPISDFSNSAAWCVSRLPVGHHSYAVQKNELPLQIVGLLFPEQTVRALAKHLEREAAWYKSYSQASIILAERHASGIPFDSSAAASLRQTQNGEAHCSGKSVLPGGSVATFNSLSESTVQNHSPQAQHAGRTATPCIGEMELRIAAALAARAIEDLKQRLVANEESWFVRSVRMGLSRSPKLKLSESGSNSIEAQEHTIAILAQRVLLHNTQRMRYAFNSGLDVHLVTAVDMARRSGKIAFRGDAQDWLSNMQPQERSKLKEVLDQERQAAKVCNFGLLYGMRAEGLHQQGINQYGLTWSLEESAHARTSWFDLYPELHLWQLWTQHVQSRKLSFEDALTWDKDTNKLCRHKFPPRLYQPKTLSGRPTATIGNQQQALSYQGHGTGADILARAISSLPKEVSGLVLMPVHDELVLEVPMEQIEKTKVIVVSTMIQAGNDILGGIVPIEVVTSVGQTW